MFFRRFGVLRRWGGDEGGWGEVGYVIMYMKYQLMK